MTVTLSIETIITTVMSLIGVTICTLAARSCIKETQRRCSETQRRYSWGDFICTCFITAIFGGVGFGAARGVVYRIETNRLTEARETKLAEIRGKTKQERAERKNIRRQEDQAREKGYKQARNAMIAAIPTEWNPIISALQSHKMRDEGKVELFRNLVKTVNHEPGGRLFRCNYPKLSLAQQHYVIEAAFKCQNTRHKSHKKRRNDRCNGYKEDLAAVMAFCVDPTLSDPLVEHQTAIASIPSLCPCPLHTSLRQTLLATIKRNP